VTRGGVDVAAQVRVCIEERVPVLSFTERLSGVTRAAL
jgi:hypothetical protein